MAHEQQRRWRQPKGLPAAVDPRDALAGVVLGTPRTIDSEALAAEQGYQAANSRQQAALGRLTSILEAIVGSCTCGAASRHYPPQAPGSSS